MEHVGGLMNNQSSFEDDETNFNICDVADEEVHFSRDMLNQYHQRSATESTLKQSHSFTCNHPTPTPTNSNSNSKNFTQTHSIINNGNSCFTDINLGGGGGGYHESTTQSDQKKSSKLLESIGSKLRRGSNYLVAPTLVGQYLLGITIQSWSEFLNTSRMMKAPTNTQQLTRRVLNNLSYFQGNYLCVSLILVIYCILTSPLLLLAIIAYLVALYMVTARSALGRHMKIGAFKPNLQQQYSFITLISLPLLWVAGAPSAVFWVIGASFVVVGLHAAMYNSAQAPELNSPESRSQYHVNYQSASYQSSSSSSSSSRQKQQPSYSSSSSSVQYYNHYPVSTQPLHHNNHQYLSLAAPQDCSPNSSTAADGLPGSMQTPTTTARAEGGGGYGYGYTSAISQWITFGTSAGYKLANSEVSSAKTKAKARIPNVTIISEDYAGLGRVYEV